MTHFQYTLSLIIIIPPIAGYDMTFDVQSKQKSRIGGVGRSLLRPLRGAETKAATLLLAEHFADGLNLAVVEHAVVGVPRYDTPFGFEKVAQRLGHLHRRLFA